MSEIATTTPGRRLHLEHYAPDLPPGTPLQGSFDDLGTPLAQATFVVVDVETTGGSPARDRITELAAVKVRGGNVLGEFATLVNPGMAIPPQITVLTGITSAMVAPAPTIDHAFPSFVEFARGAIFVAHNARFDMGFLSAAANELSLPWAPERVVDTLALARRIITREEAANHKLGSLARLFNSSTAPEHRALSDARATVDVLHGLLERFASLGVTHVDDLSTAADPVPAARRRKVHLAEGVPPTPGVYRFWGPGEHLLYVGRAANLRSRVRQYFTAAERRQRIGEMVDVAIRVDFLECPTALEAQVRELRQIAAHAPAYNQRSKRSARLPWLRLTHEPLPRLAVVRSVPAGAIGIGPFPSRAQAALAAEAFEALGIRSCTTRLPLKVAATARSCIAYELGRCSAPCINQEAANAYSGRVRDLRAVLEWDPAPAVEHHLERIRVLSAEERFEEAARLRDQISALLLGIRRYQRLSPWWASTETIGARWRTDHHRSGRWEIVVVRYGRLVASGVCPPTDDPLEFAGHLSSGAAHVSPPSDYGGAATPEETGLIATWMETPGVRLISHEGPPLAWPLTGAAYHLDRWPALAQASPSTRSSAPEGRRTGPS